MIVELNDNLLSEIGHAYLEWVDAGINTADVSFADYARENCNFMEESVNDDLEEAAKADAKFERSDDTESGYDINRYGGFIAGAKWDRLKMVDKACAWLRDNMQGIIGGQTYIDDFRKSMKEGKG